MASVQTESVKNTGGAAPADRQCHYPRANGTKCRDWAVRGQNFCGRHALFVQTHMDRPISVPLLEDEASIVLTLSDTVRRLAWGTLPVSNGRHMIAALRLANTIQTQKMQMAKLRLQIRKMGFREEEILGSEAEAEAMPMPECESEPERRPEPECRPEPNPQHEPEPQAETVVAESAAATPAADQDPKLAQVRVGLHTPQPRFRDLKKQWDKDLQKGENEMADMLVKRYGETREQFLAARATPFDEFRKEEALAVGAM